MPQSEYERLRKKRGPTFKIPQNFSYDDDKSERPILGSAHNYLMSDIGKTWMDKLRKLTSGGDFVTNKSQLEIGDFKKGQQIYVYVVKDMNKVPEGGISYNVSEYERDKPFIYSKELEQRIELRGLDGRPNYSLPEDVIIFKPASMSRRYGFSSVDYSDRKNRLGYGGKIKKTAKKGRKSRKSRRARTYRRK
jgi:hypothetical protein